MVKHKHALIIGGTSGIGAATAELLRARGWRVTVTGRGEFNVHCVDCDLVCFYWDVKFDALIFCAGALFQSHIYAFDFASSFYALVSQDVVKRNGISIAVSSVAALRPAKVDPHYAAAKAALEHYAMTLRAQGNDVRVVRFDLVRTRMLDQLPADTLKGRKIISAEAAARRIVKELEK